MVRRFGLLVTVLALVAAACEGGGAGLVEEAPDPTFEAPSTTEAAVAAPVNLLSEFDQETLDAIDAAADRALEHFEGMPDAAMAVLLAYDDGYTFDQIIAAIDAGTLDSDGRIGGEEPTGTALSHGLNAVLASYRPDTTTIEQLREALRRDDEELSNEAKAGKILLMLILTAISLEYPPDYIYEAIILGGLTEATWQEVEFIQAAPELEPVFRACNTAKAVGFKDSEYTTFGDCFEALSGRDWEETRAIMDQVYDDNGQDSTPTSDAGAPVVAMFAEAPTELLIGAEGTWLVQAQGGIVETAAGPDGYTAEVDFGDGTIVGDLELSSSSAGGPAPSIAVPYRYSEGGDYTVKLTVTDTAGSTAETAVEVTVIGRFEAVGDFWFPDPADLPFPYEVTENRVRFVVDDGDLQITDFLFYSISVPWSEFDLESGETTESTCARHGESTLDSFEGAFDPATGTLSGTGAVRQHTLDVGTNCPFGGADAIDLHPFELEATLAAPLIEGRFRYTERDGALTFEAEIQEE